MTALTPQVAQHSQFLMSPGGWTALAACVAASVAIIAAIIGGWQLSEARTLRLEQAQPYVVVFTDESGGDPRHIDLVIKNLGSTAAQDVCVTFSSPLHSAVLQEHSPIKTPSLIPVLVPGQEWRTFWDFTPARAAASEMPREYSADIAFRDSRGKKSFRFTFEIDWQVLIDGAFVTIYTVHDAARALREISALMSGWKESGGSGLRVFMRDGDTKDQRETEAWAQHEADHSKEEPPNRRARAVWQALRARLKAAG